MFEKLEKKEIVRSKKLISKLFEEGKYIGTDCLGILYLPLLEEKNSKVQVLFIVPKRKIKKAVDRNLLKRRMKEAYRKNKHQIRIKDSSLVLAMMYQKTYIQTYDFIEAELKVLLHRLNQKIEKEG